MKTITYNPETHVLVPREPSEEMLQAALRANMRHVIDCINDPTKSKDIGSEETCKQTYRSRYASMLAAAPQPEPVESEPVYQACMADSVSLSGAWIDVDKQTYHDAGLYKEYKLRSLYTAPQPDRVAELEAALKVAKAALNRAADKFHDYAEIHAAKEASPENDIKVERNLMLSSEMDKALAKINEVLKP